jgi:YD repeat-containing protein
MFNIDKASTVQLSVWDTQGRELAVLTGSRKLTGGTHQYRWNYSGQSQEIYLVRYILNGNVNIKKVITK